MKIEITYPLPSKKKLFLRDFVTYLKWIFLFTAYICPIINILTGGKAWSIIVLWSLRLFWSNVISPSLVVYNRISFFIKVISDSCVLLILIGALLSPGWALKVVPIVCFSGLAVSGILFFTDMERQKQNMFPMLLLIAASIITSAVGLAVLRSESYWAMVVMGALAAALLVACIYALGGDLIRELKKRFHTA